jgi:hypothetical protein
MITTMKRTNQWLIAAAFTALPLAAQNTGVAYQSALTLTTTADRTITLQTISGDIVTGHPFSGVEERHSLQVLGDGTRIETRSNDKYYRDDQGRTRIEREDGTVLISDPVLGAGVEMKDGKVIRRSTFTHGPNGRFGFSSTAEPGGQVQKLTREQVEAQTKAMLALSIASQVKAREALAVSKSAQIKEATPAKNPGNEEDLGHQAFGGIDAQGTRSTTTIAAGAIGNDRPINIVSERWYSADLQMTVKSGNKDPRFGETTYELTNILPGHPDPTLFQMPAK